MYLSVQNSSVLLYIRLRLPRSCSYVGVKLERLVRLLFFTQPLLSSMYVQLKFHYIFIYIKEETLILTSFVKTFEKYLLPLQFNQ